MKKEKIDEMKLRQNIMKSKDMNGGMSFFYSCCVQRAYKKCETEEEDQMGLKVR